MDLKGAKVNWFLSLLGICTLWLLAACSEERRTSVKNYPINKAFIYHNKINLNGDLPKDEKIRLGTDLENYWDDSLKARTEQRFYFGTGSTIHQFLTRSILHDPRIT